MPPPQLEPSAPSARVLAARDGFISGRTARAAGGRGDADRRRSGPRGLLHRGASPLGADVTRNLLYRYFPRGRGDIRLLAVARAGPANELTDDWVVGDALPAGRAASGGASARIAEHAMAADRRLADPPPRPRLEARRLSSPRSSPGFSDIVVSGVALNHLGTRNPPPLVRLALVGYLAFAETVLDEARTTGAPRDRACCRILADTLVATIAAAVAAGGSGYASAGGSG